MFKRFSVSLSVVMVALALFFVGAPAVNAATITVADKSASASTIVTPNAPIRWTAYDNFQIGSLSDCNHWKGVLQGYRPDIKHWKCEARGVAPNRYWVVMVGDSGNV